MSKTSEQTRAQWTYIRKGSKYKHVQKWIDRNGNFHWLFGFNGTSNVECSTEREAALRADKALIGKGKEPVNILVRK